jgi:hypothetical protein
VSAADDQADQLDHPRCAGCSWPLDDEPWGGIDVPLREGGDAYGVGLVATPEGRVYLIHNYVRCQEAYQLEGPSPAYDEWRTKLAARGEGRPDQDHPS